MNSSIMDCEQAAAPCRPFLRWAGSKRLVVPKLAMLWNASFQRYVEPFAGSAVFYFHLAPNDAYLSDINPELVNCLQMVARSPAKIYDTCASIKSARDTYNRLRAVPIGSLNRSQRAIRFLYLNRNCFNGIYRTNSRGQFNVPFSGKRTGNLPDRDQFMASAKLLGGATIVRRDFETVLLDEVRFGDFVYLDPPYATGKRRVFSDYGVDSFSTDDIMRLSAALRVIDRRGATFVLSYAYCPEAVRTFSRWETRKHYCLRNVAGFAGNRRRAAEMIVSNRTLAPIA